MMRTHRLQHTNQGFTMVELIAIVAILGVIAAIAAPSWVNLLTRQRLSDARANALSKIREAQSQALRTSRPWEACFRDVGGIVSVSVQPGGRARNCGNHRNWESLLDVGSNTIAIQTGTPGTTPALGDSTTGFSFRFGPHGDRIGMDGGGATPQQLVFTPRNQNNGPFFCVISETIIGSMREGTIRTGNMCR